MPLSKASELRQLSKDELETRLQKLKQERYDLVQKKEIGQLDRPSRFRHIRREIAQIMTVLHNQEQPSKAKA